MTAPPFPTDDSLLSLDVGATRIRAAVVGQGRVLARRSERWGDAASGEEELDRLLGIARSLAESAPEPVRAVGLSHPAWMADGVVASWPNRPHWQGLPVATRLQEVLRVPARQEEDARAATLAEWRWGAGRAVSHGMFVSVGSGIGAGLVLEGRLVRGAQDRAGGLGHVAVGPGGPPCPCGGRGCLQLAASGWALDARARALGRRDAREILAAAVADPRAHEALEHATTTLAWVLGREARLLDLSAVVLGASRGAWWRSLRAALKREAPDLELRRAALGEDAALWGAAALAADAARERVLAGGDP
jgi:glucokinase